MTGGMFVFTDQKKLVSMRAAEFAKEDDFQRLLAENPALLSGEHNDAESARGWVLVAREKGIPAEQGGGSWWSVDHLFLDQDGVPTFVEVKRQSDTRLRREVVGQMLDYAANALTYWPADEIRLTFENRVEAADQELRKQFGDSLDIDSFWERVKTNLQAGRVRLLFVADRIPQELRRIVEFLNAQMDPAEVLALELRQYEGQGGLKALVPIIYGRTEAARQKKTAGLPSRSWTKDEFLDFLRQKQGDKAVEIARRIFDWTDHHSAEISYGSGTMYASASISFLCEGRRVVPLRIWSSGSVEIGFGALLNSPFRDKKLRLDLLNRLRAIPGVNFVDDVIQKYPTISFKVLADDAQLERFFDTMSWVADALRSQ